MCIPTQSIPYTRKKFLNLIPYDSFGKDHFKNDAKLIFDKVIDKVSKKFWTVRQFYPLDIQCIIHRKIFWV